MEFVPFEAITPSKVCYHEIYVGELAATPLKSTVDRLGKRESLKATLTGASTRNENNKEFRERSEFSTQGATEKLFQLPWPTPTDLI
jgi:hypothetical protein